MNDCWLEYIEPYISTRTFYNSLKSCAKIRTLIRTTTATGVSRSNCNVVIRSLGVSLELRPWLHSRIRDLAMVKIHYPFLPKMIFLDTLLFDHCTAIELLPARVKHLTVRHSSFLPNCTLECVTNSILSDNPAICALVPKTNTIEHISILNFCSVALFRSVSLCHFAALKTLRIKGKFKDYSYIAILGRMLNLEHLEIENLSLNLNDFEAPNAQAISLVNCNVNARSLHHVSTCSKMLLRNCTNVLHVVVLNQLAEVTIDNCIGFHDVSGLGSVRKLCLKHCASISDIHLLSNVQHLELNRCCSVVTFPETFRCKTVKIVGCRVFEQSLSHVPQITLEECNFPVTLEFQCRRLLLVKCHFLQDFHRLKNVTTLKMVDCNVFLIDVSSLLKLRLFHLEFSFPHKVRILHNKNIATMKMINVE